VLPAYNEAARIGPALDELFGYLHRSGPGREGGRAASDPELVDRPLRRRFSAEYKLRILREAEACGSPGEIGALVRREGLYSAHLSKWRQQRDAGALEALGRPRGRKPDAR